jgi:DUF4097 and DUF4098 domain-containing protein YvlB
MMPAKTLLSRFLSAGFAVGACSLVARAGVGTFSAPTLDGCSVTLTDGGVIVKSQNKYVSTPMTQASPTWHGLPILVTNANGDVIVNGDPNATVVTAVAKVFAFADPDKQADGTAAISDTQSSFQVTADASMIHVACKQASQQHGSAGIGTTGCDLTVTVPAGSANQGIVLSAHSGNGQVTAGNIYEQSGSLMDLESSNGDATATGITGGAKVHTENGNAIASVTPAKGSHVEVSSGNGDATLSVPANFACDMLALAAPGGSVNVSSGFVNSVTATSTSVGMNGTGASSITVTAGTLGNATLRPQ